MSIPVFELEFDKKGKVFDSQQLTKALQGLQAGGFTDLFVISHGWNNDLADARSLYKAFFARIKAVLDGPQAPALGARKLAGLEVFWPSKKFAEEELIPGGGAASLGDELEDEVLLQQLDELKNEPERLGMPEVNPVKAAILDQAKALVPDLETDAQAQRDFVMLLRSIVSPEEAHPDDGSDLFFTRDPEEIIADLAQPVLPAAPDTDVGGAADLGGGAAGLGDLFGGAKAAARRLLNFLTYYQMKERADLVGRAGLAPVLRQIHQTLPALKFHLIGHSFGGRLVTAAADALDDQTRASTLTLLQAAYSHNGLAQKFDGKRDGFFRKVVSEKKVSGPILITHTKNDKAVGVAYPLASRIAGQDAASAAGLGDENDPYGGMGRNGAQQTPERVLGDLLPVGGTYQLTAHKVYNLNSDTFIKGHSDITKNEVAFAVLKAVATT